MKKKIVITCLSIAILLVATIMILYYGFGIPDCGRNEKSDRAYVKDLTGIEIPQNSKMLYKYKNDSLFPVQGRRPGYSVYKFETEPSDWMEANIFSKVPNEEFESEFTAEVPEWITESLSEKVSPDFNSPYYWLKTKSWVYFVYQPETLMLIIFVHQA